MGGSASLIQIPTDIFNETDVPEALLGITPNHIAAPQPHNNETVLSLLRRHSRSETSGARRFGSSKRARSSNEATSINYEIPPNVKVFLETVGVSCSDKAIENDDTRAAYQEERTRKLVGHIFDCLGALQHLVKSNQNFQSMEDIFADETQSMIEANKESVGKLLHEMINIYTVCGDTVRVLLRSTPEAAKVEDNYGRLPLHVAVDRDQPWMDTVEQLIDAYPGALDRRDSGGRLPLHIAVDREQPCPEIVRMLVTKFPPAAMARRGVGRLPLHYVIFSDDPSLQVLDHLLEACPEAAQMMDVYGRLPLHYAVSKACVNVKIVQRLLAVFRAGAAARDRQGHLPLLLALEQEQQDAAVVRTLCEAYPPAVQEVNGENKYPLHHLFSSPLKQSVQHVDVVRYLAKLYPPAVYHVTKPNAKDSPVEISITTKNADLARYLLRFEPDYNARLLRELNWQARKNIFLLVRGGSMSHRPSIRKRLGLLANCTAQSLSISTSGKSVSANDNGGGSSTKVAGNSQQPSNSPSPSPDSNNGGGGVIGASPLSLLVRTRSGNKVNYQHTSIDAATSSASPIIAGNSSGGEVHDIFHPIKSEPNSPRASPSFIIVNPTAAAPSAAGVNIFLKLHRQNMDAFREVVKFL